MLRIWIPRFSLHPPVHGSRPSSPLHRRVRFRLRIYMSEKRICTERSIIHEDSPEFPHCSFSYIVLWLFSFSVQDLVEAFSILCFLLFHSRSTLTQLRSTSLPITSSGAKVPKHPFWAFLRASLGSAEPCSGRSRFDDSTDSTFVTQDRDQSKYRVQSGRRSTSVPVTNKIRDHDLWPNNWSHASASAIPPLPQSGKSGLSPTHHTPSFPLPNPNRQVHSSMKCSLFAITLSCSMNSVKGNEVCSHFHCSRNYGWSLTKRRTTEVPTGVGKTHKIMMQRFQDDVFLK